MKFRLLLAIAAFGASAIQAGESFAKAGSADETTVAVWRNGYDMGNDDEAVIDFNKVNAQGNALIKYCADHPSEKLSDAAEGIMGKKK
jgi:hypothetical protein